MLATLKTKEAKEYVVGACVGLQKRHNKRGSCRSDLSDDSRFLLDAMGGSTVCHHSAPKDLEDGAESSWNSAIAVSGSLEPAGSWESTTNDQWTI